jgi:hypothetical protein
VGWVNEMARALGTLRAPRARVALLAGARALRHW